MEARPEGSPSSRRIALIAPRYGEDVLGGAERSLRLIAETLASRGHVVEVFTTGRGTESLNGVRIHRFAAEPVDESILAIATQKLRRATVSEDVLHDFLGQTRHSTALLEAYAARRAEFDACIVGPYGNGLTWEALRLRPERTLLVPCFHREPLAMQPALAAAYAEAGGLLYHSDAERRLAETELGAHHPNAELIGTWLAPGSGDPLRGWRLAGSDRPYLVYAGRYCREKNVPRLLDWLRRYGEDNPDRFRLAMLGGGPSKPTGADWIDFGFVSERDRADLIAGAAALVQLSTNESLSLVALEAWNEGTPVIAHAGCDVLRESIAESRGGAAVADYEQFRDALDDLWHNVEAWRARGRAGREFVQRRHHSRDDFAAKIEPVIAGLDRPLAEIMRQRGLAISAGRTPADWQRAFADRVDAVLHADPIDPDTAAAAASARRDDPRLNARLADAATLAELPDGYEDVSEGPLARWKRAVKHKLLHQFQASYVDVLSRQQSEMNRVLLDVVRELAERVDFLERQLDASSSGKPQALAPAPETEVPA